MVAIRGHFDGRFIVPDEPVQLPVNQRLILHVETAESAGTPQPNFREWIGLGNRAPHNERPKFVSDDELWQ